MTEEETMDAGALRGLTAFVERWAGHSGACCTFDDQNHVIVTDESCRCNADSKAARAALAALAAAREPVAPAEAAEAQTAPRAMEEAANRAGYTFTVVGGEWQLTVLAQPPAPASAAGAWEALRERINEIAEWYGTATGQRAAREAIDQHRPAIEAAIRGTTAGTPLDAALLQQAIEVGCRGGYVPEMPLDVVAERAAHEYHRLVALRGQPSETPAAGDGEAGA